MASILDSRFWEWYRKHRPVAVAADDLRSEALNLLVECIKSGEVTSMDSVESAMSHRISERFGTSEFEMNSLWIGADQDWKCPCCDRTKFEISRLGKNGQILAKLVVHHDHMGDAMQEAFHVEFAKAGTEVAQVDGLKLVERMGSAFAAFTNTLVCEDCNHADVLATQHIDAPSYFSFSIGQMRLFIQPRAHATHQVNYDIVNQIWAKAEAAYRLRMSLIQKVAEASATDKHWYEPTPSMVDPTPAFGLSHRRLGDAAIKEWIPTETLFRVLGQSTTVGARDYSKWRKVKPKATKPLPTNYLAMLRSEPVFATRWDDLPENWKCPVCQRNKTEIVYVGGKGKITFGVHSHNAIGAWRDAQCFCVNCMTVLLGLKHEVEAQAGITLKSSYDFVAPQEISKIILPKPHAAHGVDAHSAQKLLKRILEETACLEERSSGKLSRPGD